MVIAEFMGVLVDLNAQRIPILHLFIAQNGFDTKPSKFLLPHYKVLHSWICINFIQLLFVAQMHSLLNFHNFLF